MKSALLEDSSLAIVIVATYCDAEPLASLILRFREFLKQDELVKEDIYAAIEIALLDTSIEFLLAVMQYASLVGYTQSRDYYSLWLLGVETTIEDVFVVREVRGRGVVSHLLRTVIASSKDRGSKLLALNTNERNVSSLHLYTHGSLKNIGE